MRICIYGAGAIGGHLAARYAAAGMDVSVIARGPHLAAIKADGLTLETAQGTTTHRLRASADPAELGEQDAVIVAVKATAIATMAEGLKPLMRPHTPIVFALNGIPWWYADEIRGTAGPIARAVERASVIGCVVNSANTVVAPGVIHNDTHNNRFIMGELDGGLSDRLVALTDGLTAEGVKGEATGDIRAAVWGKLLRNAMSGSVACLTGANGREIAGDPDLAAICLTIAREVTAVAAALGIRAVFDPAQLRPENYTTHKASILQDLELGRPMEIDAIAGAVQEVGRLHGVPTPTLDIVHALIRKRAALLGLYP
jgi:2-dehydropantoate 2-reductase